MMLGARTGAWAKSVAPLPYDAEVEWLQSDGYSFFDTKISGSSEVSIDLNFLLKVGNNTSQNCVIFGSRTANGVLQYVLLSSHRNGSGVWGFGTDPSGHYRYGWLNSTVDFERFNFKNTAKHNVMVINETNKIVVENSSFDNLLNLYIFAWNSNRSKTFQNPDRCRFCGGRIYLSGELVRDYKVVRVGNVGCLYDSVSNQLSPNAGTGAFIIGPDKTT